MKDRLINGFSVFEVLDDDSLQQRRCHLSVPDALGIHHNDRSVATHAQARGLTALYALRAKEKILALEQVGQQRVKLASATVGRAEIACAYEHVMRVRLHFRLLSVTHSEKIHMLTRAHTCPGVDSP